jgi:hypothetical protein
MVQIKRKLSDRPSLQSLRRGIFIALLLLLAISGIVWTLIPSLQNRGVIAYLIPFLHVQLLEDPKLLTDMETTKISTDVRGNLGPPEAMLNNGTDWLKDRWQAASDMHGTAIKGHHWVLLEFQRPISIYSVVLDWEAAYSKNYILEGSLDQEYWSSLYDTQAYNNSLQWSEENYGQSPGVKTKTPLHVVHTMKKEVGTSSPIKLQYLRLTIRSSAMGWGVSLWQFKVNGFSWP